jgi:uncharacterized protein YbjT (DUF2867 family)
VTWIKADYENPKQLAQILQGVDVVLSLISENNAVSITQKNLIDASIQAGVKRFAPSEWASYVSTTPRLMVIVLIEYVQVQF